MSDTQTKEDMMREWFKHRTVDVTFLKFNNISVHNNVIIGLFPYEIRVYYTRYVSYRYGNDGCVGFCEANWYMKHCCPVSSGSYTNLLESMEKEFPATDYNVINEIDWKKYESTVNILKALQEIKR